MPRHPPYALNNLTTKMLASTVQFSNTNQKPPHRNHLAPTQGTGLTTEMTLNRSPSQHTQTVCCLRTQQCAKHIHNPTPATRPFHASKPAVLDPDNQDQKVNSSSRL